MKIRILVLLLLSALGLGAHELGALRLRATFGPGTVRVEGTVDAEHLPPFLRPSGAAAVWDRTFLAGIRADFDGRPFAFDRAAWLDAPGPGPRRFLLEGRVPSGVSGFRLGHTAAVGTFLVTVAEEGREESSSRWMEGGRPGEAFPLEARVVPPSAAARCLSYLRLGYLHILPGGLDHILFVLGLFLLCLRWKPLLQQVTAFTLAHSLSLGLSLAGVVALPSRVVEPLIALSIAWVAAENVLTTKLRPARLGVVFAFGLLHGLGFAGALAEAHLGPGEFVPALLSFNLGVEGGQLTVLALAFLAVGWARSRAWYRPGVVVPASLLIAATGLFWTVQRL